MKNKSKKVISINNLYTTNTKIKDAMSEFYTEQPNILVIGDVHGCFHTLKSMIEQHWQQPELLVQLGDLIDRGNFSGETVQFVQRLQQLHPQQVKILRGNHEQELIEYVDTQTNQNWLRQRGQKTLASFLKLGMSLSETVVWMKNLPLYWENENIFITHAGIAPNINAPFKAENREGVVWTRQSLKNIGKVQVVGHTPTFSSTPEYNAASNSWYIDTGACFNKYLSAIKLTPQGQVIEIYRVKTKALDVAKTI